LTSALSSGSSLYNPGPLPEIVEEIVLYNPTPKPADAAVQLGQGTWEVFSAPHITKLLSSVGIRFEPVRFTLDGTHISSNVKFRAPLGVEGWLSAAGRLVPRPGGDTVEVAFTDFWVDYGAQALRKDITQGIRRAPGTLDQVITQLGRLAFFPQLSVYPVLYLDADLCVFKFKPMESTIACRKVGPPDVEVAASWTIDGEA